LTRLLAQQVASLADAAAGVVRYVQPNYLHHLRGAVKTATPVVNDPQFPQQYPLQNTGQTGGVKGADMKVTDAWKTANGAGVVVALADTNIDITHPDLAANIWTNPGEIADNKIDDDHNGYVDDVHGWNFGKNSNRPQDGKRGPRHAHRRHHRRRSQQRDGRCRYGAGREAHAPGDPDQRRHHRQRHQGI